jgi:TonB family protein
LAADTVLYSIYFTSADILNSTPSTEFDQIAIDQIAIHFQANRSEGLPTGTFTAFTIWGKNKFGDLSIKTDKSLQLHITQKDSLYTIETNDLSSSGSKSENDIVSFTFYNRLHRFTDEEVLAATEGKLGLLIKDPVEQMPEFPGGTSALMTWLNRNITYPTIAEENGIQGRVTCSFVVERDGSVTDVKVVVSVDVSLDNEAVRVLSMMPKWNPGMQRGNFVRVRYSVPITFRLYAKRKTAGSLIENSGTISYDDIKYTIIEDD